MTWNSVYPVLCGAVLGLGLMEIVIGVLRRAPGIFVLGIALTAVGVALIALTPASLI